MNRETPKRLSTILQWVIVILLVAVVFATPFIHTFTQFLFLIAAFVAIVVVTLWVIGTINIHNSSRLAADPKYATFDPDGPEAPPSVSAAITSAGNDLTPLK